jgi:hypothetical protein
VQASSGDRTARELLQKRTPILDVISAMATETGDDDDATGLACKDLHVVGSNPIQDLCAFCVRLCREVCKLLILRLK